MKTSVFQEDFMKDNKSLREEKYKRELHEFEHLKKITCYLISLFYQRC